MAINVDVKNGAVYYKCYGECGHPLMDDGDIRQSMRIEDLPLHLRVPNATTGASDETTEWALENEEWLLEQAVFSDNGFARVYFKFYADKNLRCVSPTGEGFVWNKQTLLWEGRDANFIIADMSEVLQSIYNPFRERVESMSKTRWNKLWN